MHLLRERKAKKIEKYKNRLRESHFNSYEISQLENIYKKVVSLSNIFISNIIMFITSIILVIVAATSKNDFFIETKDIFIWTFSSISAVLVIVSWVLTLLLFIKVLVCHIKEVRKKVLIWAILSIFPLISFITLFIMKWKVSHIYKARK